jgi:predicted metal-dependent hydrolase
VTFGIRPPSLDGVRIDVERTNRKKTVSFQVGPGRVRVIAPKRLGNREIRRMLEKREPWIREQLLFQQSRPKPKEYVSGEPFTYLGKTYPLRVLTAGSPGVKLKNGRLSVSVPHSPDAGQGVREQLVTWYWNCAQRLLGEKTRARALALGVIPKSVSVRHYKSRWGSCGARGDIRYNWHIIMAPPGIVDYVVVHEVCHLRHLNHSRDFWHCVESQFPGYRDCRNWLKANGITLTL